MYHNISWEIINHIKKKEKKIEFNEEKDVQNAIVLIVHECHSFNFGDNQSLLCFIAGSLFQIIFMVKSLKDVILLHFANQ